MGLGLEVMLTKIDCILENLGHIFGQSLHILIDFFSTTEICMQNHSKMVETIIWK